MSTPPLPKLPLNTEIANLSEIKTMAQRVFQGHCNEAIQDIFKYSADSFGDLTKLRKQMCSLAESQREIQAMIHGLEEIHCLTERGNFTAEEAIAKFEESVSEFQEDSDNEDEQQAFISSLDSVLNENNKEDSMVEDSDILVTKTTISYKDPLTQCLMKDPVKSKFCNHAYERESILKYIGETKKRCPYSGCQVVLGRKDLVEHFALKLKLLALEDNLEN